MAVRWTWVRQAVIRWWFWSPRRKGYSVVLLSLLVLGVVLSFFLWTGVASALQARERFQEVEADLSRLSPVDLLDLDLYRSLSTRFGKAEQSAGRARSRLRYLGWFTWLPGIGGRIQASLTQLEMGYFLARGGNNLAAAYQGALEAALSELDAKAGSQRVAGALEKSLPRLLQAEQDIQRVQQLRGELGDAIQDSRYVSLIDTFLPQILAVIYISRVSPQAIGHGYVLGQELTAMGNLAADPLLVLANPAEAHKSLAIIVDHSRQLAMLLEAVKDRVGKNGAEPAAAREEVLAVIELMAQGAALLENVTAVTQGLLALAEAVEKYGFLTRNFGQAARIALNEAEARLALARDEAVALEALVARKGSGGHLLLSSIPRGDAHDDYEGPATRLKASLQLASNVAGFLQWLLGFRGPRTYLLLGQNQQEIRASGGFIGVAVQATVDQGELVNLVYHESTTVDPQPPKYPLNPLPPDPIYWYLWMGRLLFRDANWSPHFPVSAARLADLYRLGQQVSVDGVITGSKGLMADMAALLGDIRVAGVAEPLTRETVSAYADGDLPFECKPHHKATRGNRCFDEALFLALHDRLASRISGQERGAMLQLFKTALAQRSILVHVLDPEEGRLLWELGWNGAISPVDHDYLLVVDSSLPGHTTKNMQRHLNYQVSLQVGKPVAARLRMRYQHQGTWLRDRVCRQAQPGGSSCYWNYFRIYLPRTATHVQAPPVPLHEGSEKLIWGYRDPDSRSLVWDADVGPARLTEVGGYIAVEPGTLTTIPLEYQLPWEIVRSKGQGTFEYRLLVQKQPGMDRDRVSVVVELPRDAQLITASPAPKSQNGVWVAFDFSLDSDKEVVIVFKAPGAG